MAGYKSKNAAPDFNNRIVVTSQYALSGVLDSNKEYFIDGIIDMGNQSIEVPAGGLNLTGFNFNASKLISSEPNYEMFTSPVGGSGDIIGKDYAIEVTGTNSKVYNIVSATGFDAFEFARINYNNCSSLGTIDSYRQGLEVGTGRFGGSPTLTLIGTWIGGFFIDTSIVRSLDAGMTGGLFEAGAGFIMQSRFRSNQNIDLPTNANFVDFAPSNFTNPSTLQLDGCIITRNGVFNADDTNITPNISNSNLASSWTSNFGMQNTFVGGKSKITTEIETTINTLGVYEDVAGTYTVDDLQHFSEPANGQLMHLGNNPREFRFIGGLTIDGVANDEVRVNVVKYNSSLSSFTVVGSQVRQVNNFAGGRDVAFFTILAELTLDQNDYVKIQVANLTGTGNLTMEIDSFIVVSAR